MGGAEGLETREFSLHYMKLNTNQWNYEVEIFCLLGPVDLILHKLFDIFSQYLTSFQLVLLSGPGSAMVSWCRLCFVLCCVPLEAELRAECPP